MFLDDELLTSTHCNWLFGEDNSGDILKWSEHYLKDIVTNERCFHLITADGSIYCQDNPSNQELVTYSLLQAEIKTSLSLLEAGGSFVLKMYTMFREETATTVAQLMSHFEDVHLFKPSSSKPGNSEVYLVCRGYIPKGLNDECTPIMFLRSGRFIRHSTIYLYGSCCRENPWRFDKANDVVERLRNITYEGAIRAIEQMLLDGCLSDQLGKEESRIQAEICLECDGCKWLDLMEQGKMNELATTFGLPSSSDGEFADIRHSLFVDVSMIPLAEATKTHLFDLCESSFTIGNKARNMRDFIVSDGCSMEVHCDRMTQQDWLDVLMQICHSRIDRDAVAKTALSIKSNRPMLILSRFAASIIVYLSMLFSQVSLLAPVAFNEHVGEIICCRQPNTNFHNYEFFSKYLSEISENLRKTDQLLMSFVPLCQLACEKLYSNIRLFNTACVMQIFSRIYANYANTKCHEDDNRHKRDDPFVQLKLTEKLAADAFS
ncbi:unnamed protein product [Toxocara canis]|uniref:Cap-specific mRNA (nucleoside-2'-O-)-methyltransferase 2 n=1 Tax=Toxocara canis TaxID=6265 RepID=A0A183V8V7_TOXCA|nr:unnamed protein product [Toxocara canis]